MKLGLQIQLGHRVGEACAVRTPQHGMRFVVIHTNGIHEVNLGFCGCERQLDVVTQLLRFRLLPATVQEPATAATFQCLHHFQILSFESKCSAYEFYHTLLRETDNTGLLERKVRFSP